VFAIAPQRRDRSSSPDAPADAARGSAIDVAPTVLAALGLPLSRELAGTPQSDLLMQWPPHADRYVDSYGRPFVEPAPRVGKPLDQEMIDRLRSLGYVK
jgi:arylsulfatase A-like enzyme